MIIQMGMDNDLNISVHVYLEIDGILVHQEWRYFSTDEFGNFIEFLNKYTTKYICNLEFEWVY